jgi:hypothetical protein
MVKKFTTNCNFGAQQNPVTLYVGEPAIGSHPLGFQNKWLSTSKGGAVPANIMKAFDELRDISEKNRVPFEDLCAYVIEELNSRKALQESSKQATAIANPQKENAQVKNNAATQTVKKEQVTPPLAENSEA